MRIPRARLIQLHGRHELLMEEDVVRATFWREYDGFVANVLGVDGGKDSP
jgi:hypothetical protein